MELIHSIWDAEVGKYRIQTIPKFRDLITIFIAMSALNQKFKGSLLPNDTVEMPIHPAVKCVIGNFFAV